MELKRAKVIRLDGNLLQDKNGHQYKGMITSDGNLFTNGKQIGRLINDEGDLLEQYLYITTDDEIKVGDWVICNVSEATTRVFQVLEITPPRNTRDSITLWFKQDGKDVWMLINDCKKIIATTAQLLLPNLVHLPQPTQSFIEKYCGANGIDEVNVEYCSWVADDEEPVLLQSMLKVSSHNTITIRAIKDSWGRSEVSYKLMMAVASFAAERGLTPTADKMKVVNDWTTKWSKQNL